MSLHVQLAYAHIHTTAIHQKHQLHHCTIPCLTVLRCLQVFTHMSQVLTLFSHCPQQMSCHPCTHPHGSSGSLDVPPSLTLAWARVQAWICMHCTVTHSAWRPLYACHAHELNVENSLLTTVNLL